MEEIREQIARHDEKIRTLFEQQKQIKSLAESTNRLAVSVEKLATQMMNHEARIGEIEREADISCAPSGHVLRPEYWAPQQPI